MAHATAPTQSREPGARGHAVDRPHRPNRRFAVGLARAAGGAILFSLPLLMTMEMWWMGFYMDPHRLAVLLAVAVPFLTGLSYLAGFEDTFSLVEDLVDALVALAVGFAAGGALLLLFGAIGRGSSADEVIGAVALQAVPGAVGALLAQSQFGEESAGRSRRMNAYHWELFLMSVGALFLALNVAPTEEVVLMAVHSDPLVLAALPLVSLVVMHGFVYSAEFRGRERRRRGAGAWGSFFRFTVPGYAIAVLMSAGVLWVFGRFEQTDVAIAMRMALVLGLPAAVGAAAARLVL
jgi:putative integral membrane protein (TIGR02587 family)